MHTPILIVEDEPSQRMTLARLAGEKLGYQVFQAENGKQALQVLKDSEHIQLVLLDLRMPEMDGLETLRTLRETHPTLPVIIITASDDLQDAVSAMQLGANDFIIKPVPLERLKISILNALKFYTLTEEVTRLKRSQSGETKFSDLIGHQDGLENAVTIGKKAAASDIPVLISGESGVGKELFARAIHGESRRAGKPFVAVNCGAIPEKLVESTLFGHEKGAFTGAVNRAIGKFREADGGTLFLDEIGELPHEVQVKLLRALQQKEIEPVGASKVVKVDVRIISATNRQLPEEVRAGRFREDLFFRLNVFPLTLPPLHKRSKDIPDLIQFFIERFAASENKPVRMIAPEAEKTLISHRWPGNVRELENAIFRAVVMAESDTLTKEDFLMLEDLDYRFTHEQELHHPPEGQTTAHPAFFNLLFEDGKMKKMADIEWEVIQYALTQAEDNVGQAAKLLGMSQSTLYRKLGERK
ncbi:MAG: sigma-54-dependent Fis family transcriptional regulator [Hyphomicrobiales bacterium]|nr:sigma-54-dependent Fis family transcriptional regulator [Rickettsiales bacterium]MCP5361016.1 sigma-54-dependent Fis family transcriptional regulator [Hyphomicrobiales bacterium]